MRRKRRRSSCRVIAACLAAGFLFVLTATLALAGCGGSSPAPAGPPDQTGYVLAVTRGHGHGVGALLLGPVSTMGEASVTVTLDTVWARGARTIPARPLDNALLGQRVAVKFTGPVAESFPVQATAAWIRLLPTATGSIEGRTMVAGGPLTKPRPEAHESVAVHWGDEDGPILSTVPSDQTGRFHIELKPGDYTLVTLPNDDKTPAARHLTVEPRTPVLIKLIESVR